MAWRKKLRKVHLWLGFACGLVVLISMLAAAIFVWDKELTDWYYDDLVFVQPGKTALPVSSLLHNAQSALPGKQISDIDISNKRNRAYVFTAWRSREEGPGWTHWDDYIYWEKVYIDQYTGKVLGTMNMLHNWIDLTRRLHQNLLLRYAIGHYVVGISTLIIFAMIITGIVLWFPKNRAAIRQRFTIRWNARWRRVNFDMHAVGGFYGWILIATLATTGLVWTFDWWTNGIYRVLGTDPQKVWQTHEKLAMGSPLFPQAVDKALAHVVSQRPSWTSVSLGVPVENSGTEISAWLSFDGPSGWDENDSYYYHPSTGEVLATHLQEKKSLGAKWRNSNYAIHVGSIYGVPTKILASLTALFCASLPVTGFYLWLGRKRKQKTNTRSVKVSATPIPDVYL